MIVTKTSALNSNLSSFNPDSIHRRHVLYRLALWLVSTFWAVRATKQKPYEDGIAVQHWSICSVIFSCLATLSHPPNTTVCVLIDVLQPPTRDITVPLRFPISNVFKGQGSGTGVSGRLCGGIVQVGEKLRILPGDETAIVKCEPFSVLPDKPALISKFLP